MLNTGAYIADQNRINVIRDKMGFQLANNSTLSNPNYTMDASGTLFAAKELEWVEAQVYMTEYAAFMARQVFPIKSEGAGGYDTISYKVMDYVGKAMRLNNGNDNNIPLVDLAMKKVTSQIRRLGVAYGYSMHELKQAALTRLRLEESNALAARDVLRRDTDEIAWFGDAEMGIPSFVDNPLIPKGNAPAQWSASTPDEIIAQVRQIFSEIFINTKQIEDADTLLLPTAQYELLFQPRTSTSDTSIYTWLTQNILNRGGVQRKIIPVPELAGAGTGGVDIMIAYKRDQRKLHLSLPLDVQVEAPQLTDMFWKVNMHTATAGVIVKYPLSINIKEDI